MVSNFVKSFIQPFRGKGSSVVVNLFALALCMAGALLLVLYVNHELSYDSFHDEKGIYRVESRLWDGANLTDNWATTSYGHGPAMAEHTPQIESYVRLTAQDREQRVFYEDRTYAESRYCYAEPNFFKLFNYPIISGDKRTPLDRPQTVVVSQSAAKRYFGAQDPLGKKLTFRTPKSERAFEVTAVMQDMPENSNLRYDFILSYASIPLAMQNVWYIHGVYTYVKLRDGAHAHDVENLFASYSDQYRTQALQHKDWRVELVPIEDIHLNAQKPYEKEVKGNPSVVLVLSLMALALMVIGWLNFLNLTIARTLDRAKESVLRRVYGASGRSIVMQLLSDAFTINLSALLMAIAVVVIVIPIMAGVVGVVIPITSLLSVAFLVSAIMMLIAGTLIMGLYPARIVLRIKLVDIMRGKFASSLRANKIRELVLGFQLICSFVLICGTLVVDRQISYMKEQPLGVNVENTIVVKYPSYNTEIEQSMDGFRNDLLSNSHVSAVAVCGAVPGGEVANYFSVRKFGQQISQGKLMQMLAVDNNYPTLYGLKMVGGRSFNPDASAQDDYKVILNAQAVSELGYLSPEDALGDMINVEVVGEPLEIIGVSDHFHQQSLNEPYKPIVIIMKERLPMVATPYISVRFTDRTAMSAGVNVLEQVYARYFPQAPIDYFVLSDFYDNQYSVDRDFGNIFGLAASLAIFVSCIGLWVLFLFVTRNRMSEVCLRKIYGASPISLFWLLIRRFLLITLISTIIGGFTSYYLLSGWLEGYAFHVGVEWWIYPTACGVLVIVGTLTVLYQIVKAIRENPVRLFTQ